MTTDPVLRAAYFKALQEDALRDDLPPGVAGRIAILLTDYRACSKERELLANVLLAAEDAYTGVQPSRVLRGTFARGRAVAERAAGPVKGKRGEGKP